CGAFGAGDGEYAGSRAISLSPSNMPHTDPSKTVTAWGRAAEKLLDPSAGKRIHSAYAQPVADLINDKDALEHFGGRLLNPALDVYSPDGVMGALTNATPVTNAMLADLFAFTDQHADPNDMLVDAHNAIGQSSWQEPFGQLAAFAVRMIQAGSPMIVLEDPI